MENEECAKLLVELHSDYVVLAEKYGWSTDDTYAEAVAMAIMALAERKNDDK